MGPGPVCAGSRCAWRYSAAVKGARPSSGVTERIFRACDLSMSLKAEPLGSPPFLTFFQMAAPTDSSSDISFLPPTAYSAKKGSPGA
jgi:hypothetical protein